MPRLLQDWVTAQAARRPEATAIVTGPDRLTYGDLDALSTRLATVLREVGCQQGDRVALLVPKSPLAVVGLLAIYKADCVYVPLDHASPAARLRRILDSCEPRVLLTGGPVERVLGEIVRGEREAPAMLVGSLENQPAAVDGVRFAFTFSDVMGMPTRPVAPRNGPHAAAHILFTSGSTGSPKGVVIAHLSVIEFIEWATRYFGTTSSDRFSGHPPLQFDISLLDIFGAAAVGGELHLVPPELNLLPNRLAEFIRASQLTQWFSVPSVLNYLARFDVVGARDFPALKRVLWAGEVLPTPTLIYWMRRLPHVRFTNLYGPTETTILSSYYTVPACPTDPHAAIPIGTACDGEELLVLDESLRPVRRGETGELGIAGVGLARGYWRDTRRTADAFVRHPLRPSERIYRTGDLARIGDDGLAYFLGRADSQIKSRGYRIELGEIEAVLSTVAGIGECAVVPLKTNGFESVEICCAYVPAGKPEGTDPPPTVVRRELSRLLPGYMLPTRWLVLDRLPQSASGKIDRRRLQDVFEEGVDRHAAQVS